MKEPVAESSNHGTWEVWRQDDNGSSHEIVMWGACLKHAAAH
jgi:hypothetical protein